MKRVYTASNLVSAQLASDLLASAGIPNHVFNAHAAGALGDVPFTAAWPEVWVERDAQADAATALIAADANTAEREHACPHCGERNPGNFLSCWHCGGALAAG